MGIHRFLIETAIIMLVIFFLVVILNTLQMQHTASKHFSKLQEQHCVSTLEIYRDELIGNLLIKDDLTQKSLLKEMSHYRNLGLRLTFDDQVLTEGIFASDQPIKTHKFNLSNNRHAKLEFFELAGQAHWIFGELWWLVILEVLGLGCGFLFLWHRFRKRLLDPLAHLVMQLKNKSTDSYQIETGALVEVHNLNAALNQMSADVKQKAMYEAEVKAGKQVCHDIRSPLSSLFLSLSHADCLAEEQRITMRAAVQRITDIVNTLDNKTRVSDNNVSGVHTYMISSLVNSVITEKRLLVRQKGNININLNLKGSYGLFSRVNLVEFKRMLSNLINNSIEACDSPSNTINITVKRSEAFVQIEIADDGSGIPTDILKKLGYKQLSYGKEHRQDSGSGLGIPHAYTTMNDAQGSIHIDSMLEQGTTISLTLPAASAPSWFVEAIHLNHQQTKIIILDDDNSIHNLWRHRFAGIGQVDIQLIDIFCVDKFREYCNTLSSYQGCLFLVDYELLDEALTGIELIEEFQLSRHSILVTSHYEEDELRKTTQALGVRMIPKNLSAFVPIVPLLDSPAPIEISNEDPIAVLYDKHLQTAHWLHDLQKQVEDICYFNKSDDFIAWWQCFAKQRKPFTLLVEHKLSDDLMTGLELIQLLNIKTQSYLIVDEDCLSVQAQCKLAGIRYAFPSSEVNVIDSTVSA